METKMHVTTDTMNASTSSTFLNGNTLIQYLVSGFWILIITSISTFVCALFEKLKVYFINYAWTSLNITNQEPPFEWVMSYLDEILKKEERKNVKINLKVDNIDRLREDYVMYKESGGVEVDSSVDNVIGKELGEGNHWILYKGSKLHIQVSSADKISTRGWENEPFHLKSLTITAFGSSLQAEELLNDFVEDARIYFSDKKFEETAKIYFVSKWGNWMHCEQRKDKRKMNSVVLDSNTGDFLLHDVKQFLSEKQWYREHGIPYRRGYCLYGPPGNGKSSFVVALASELSLKICVLTLSAVNMDDAALNELLSNAPPRSILLLEDIDSIFVNREASDFIKSNRVTFSGLLNALDGVIAQEEKIIFMTTNHIEKLDPALLRPGRCDIKVRFGNATKDQVRKMFLRFNPGCSESQAQKFVDCIPEEAVSCSALQEHFLKYEDPKDAIENYQAVLKDPKREREDLENYSSFTTSKGLSKWLIRLGIPQYTNSFHIAGLYSLEDLKFNASILSSLHDEIPEGHCSRIESMLKGDIITKSLFQLAPSSAVTSLMSVYYGKVLSDTFIDQIANKVSSYQLLEYFTKYNGEEAEKHVNELLNPSLTLELSQLEKASILDVNAPVSTFIENLPLSKEQIANLQEKLKEENIYTVEDICECNIGDFDLNLKKGEQIELAIAFNELKKKYNDLQVAISNCTPNEQF